MVRIVPDNSADGTRVPFSRDPGIKDSSKPHLREAGFSCNLKMWARCPSVTVSSGWILGFSQNQASRSSRGRARSPPVVGHRTETWWHSPSLGVVDSLAVYSLTGDRIWTHPFDELRDLDWCLGGIVASVMTEGRRGYSGSNPSWRGSPSLRTSASTLCDLLSRRVLDYSPGHRRRTPHPRNAGHSDRRDHPFPPQDRFPTTITWLPEETTDVPIAVRAESDTIRIDWGEKRNLTAVMIRSDHLESSGGHSVGVPRPGGGQLRLRRKSDRKPGRSS